VIPPLRLCCAERSHRLRVVAVDGEDALALRLQDMGLLPGTAIELIGAAPFGDPLLFRLRGFRLALRRDEARRVRVVTE
jgi:ferrous iron transport protein A